jgi:hypothetical protein
MVDAP